MSEGMTAEQIEAFERLKRQREEANLNPPERRPVIVRLSDVASEPVQWIWPGWLARGLLTILGGYGGDGKSTLLMSLIATLSRAGVLPDGRPAPLVNTLILSAEDDANYAISPRLEIHGADKRRIVLMKGTDSGDGKVEWFNLRKDCDQMREVIEAEDIGLVIIDPISSYMPKADRNSEGDVRDALMPLQVLMEETRVAVIGVMHVGKAEGNRRAIQRLIGSTAFTALPRSVWMVHDLPDEHQPGYDPNDPTVGKRKALGVVKSNYAIPPPALSFSRPLDGPLSWHGKSPASIEECFAEDVKKSAPRTTEAVEWLAEFLKGGSRFSNDIADAAEEADISTGTLRIAKRKLNVQTYKDTGAGGRWLWKLPNGPAEPNFQPVATGWAVGDDGQMEEFEIEPAGPFTWENTTIVLGWLTDELKGGPVPAEEIRSRARDSAFGRRDPKGFVDAVERARMSLGVQTVLLNGQHHWKLADRERKAS